MKIKLGKNKVTAAYVAKLCGGKLIPESMGDVLISSVCTDSRDVENETLFCAIKGETTDGHKYIGTSGCCAALCNSMPSNANGVAGIVVDDTVKSLGRFAAGYCKNDLRKTVAVTGSVGKTTTKEFIGSVLPINSSYKTKGNYNSVIGLPLSMLEIPKDCTYAVLEMGMSGLYEIESMSKTAAPDIAVITNIGSSHLELLGSRENIYKAKLEITKGLKPNGILLINGDDAMLSCCKTEVKTMSVGMKNRLCDFFADDVNEDENGISFNIRYFGKSVKARINTIGLHNVYAALFAFAVGILLELNETEIIEGLSRFVKPKLRQNIFELSGITIIEDCYNSSPESVRAAIDVQKGLAERHGGRMVALLGSMLDLGADTAELHMSIGKYAEAAGLKQLVTFGDLAKNIAKGASGIPSVGITDTNDPESAAEALMRFLKKGDVLLIKASRALAAERITQIIINKDINT